MNTKEEKEKILLEIELRKVKALEKISSSLDALTIWFEEIDKVNGAVEFNIIYQNFMVRLLKIMKLQLKIPI